jgi:hypothetical protein
MHGNCPKAFTYSPDDTPVPNLVDEAENVVRREEGQGQSPQNGKTKKKKKNKGSGKRKKSSESPENGGNGERALENDVEEKLVIIIAFAFQKISEDKE